MAALFRNGLVSVSFRKETPEAIIRYACGAGLECIEWGADVHCPPDQPARLKEVSRLTEEAGLETSSYGTYFRLGASWDLERFKRVCEAAKLLKAPVVRIWGGEKGSEAIGAAEWEQLVSQARETVSYAGSQELYVTLECHPNTVTDSYESSLKFIKECAPESSGTSGASATSGSSGTCGTDRLWMYWQPNQFKSPEYNLDAARLLAPYTVNLHVFNWSASERFPLAKGTDRWMAYLAEFRLGLKTSGDCWNRPRSMELEFMYDDRPESLKSEAETLRLLNK